jgi:hypothetical protein
LIHNLLKQNGIDSPSQWDSRDPRLLKRGILFSKDEKGSSSEMIHAYSTGHPLSKDKKGNSSEERAEYITPAKTVT